MFSSKITPWRRHGHRLYRANAYLFRAQLGLYRHVRPADGGQSMNPLYLIAGVITIGLLIYLVLALLKPEWFG